VREITDPKISLAKSQTGCGGVVRGDNQPGWTKVKRLLQQITRGMRREAEVLSDERRWRDARG